MEEHEKVKILCQNTLNLMNHFNWIIKCQLYLKVFFLEILLNQQMWLVLLWIWKVLVVIFLLLIVARDYDLAHGFPQPHVVNGPNNGYYVQKEVQASSTNQLIADIPQIQMFFFQYANSSNVQAIRKMTSPKKFLDISNLNNNIGNMWDRN